MIGVVKEYEEARGGRGRVSCGARGATDMSDWIDEEARLGGASTQGRVGQAAAGEAAAAAGAAPNLWDGLRARVEADVRKINEKLGARLGGGGLRFVEPGAGAFEVRRPGSHAVSLRVTRVEGFVIVKYTRSGDADTHRTEEFRRLEIDTDEGGNECLKARDGQLFSLEDASRHLLKPLLG